MLPGDELRLFGSWGENQDRKQVVINKGRRNFLNIVSWNSEELITRVPKNLTAGEYKVGVYCNPPEEGGTYSSGFKSVTVLSDAVPVSVTPTPLKKPTRKSEKPKPIKTKDSQSQWFWLLLLLALPFLLGRRAIRAPTLHEIQREPSTGPSSWKGSCAGSSFTVTIGDEGRDCIITVTAKTSFPLSLTITKENYQLEEYPDRIEKYVTRLFESHGVTTVELGSENGELIAHSPQSLAKTSLDQHTAESIAYQLVLINKTLS